MQKGVLRESEVVQRHVALVAQDVDYVGVLMGHLVVRDVEVLSVYLLRLNYT